MGDDVFMKNVVGCGHPEELFETLKHFVHWDFVRLDDCLYDDRLYDAVDLLHQVLEEMDQN